MPPFFGADFLAKETHLICCIGWMRCVLWLDFSMRICLCAAGGEGVEGAIAKPPPRSRRSEIPAFRKRAAMSERPATRSRPFGATMCRRLVERLGGRVCGRAKLLAGTLRCLRLCWRFPWNWSPEKQLGRCPKPHKGRCPLTLQGEIFPLTPFARLSCFLFPTLSAC